MEATRDVATSNLVQASAKRADTWNKRAVDRQFSVGDSVWVGKPGLDLKLRESWIGPCKIAKKNSAVSYSVQTEDRLIPTVHIQQLKADHTPKKVKRVTSILEQDAASDEITDRFAEAHIQEQTLSETQQSELDTVLEKFKSVLDKEPGLTTLVQFEIDKGEEPPIYKRPYGIPVALRDKVEGEIDWLLERGFIRPSSSPWASPMVTVKKADGSARLCVDFRKINGLTRQTPFYMPRVEEVLEGVGQAKFISKLDLSKVYYEVQLAENSIQKTAFTSHRGCLNSLGCPSVSKTLLHAFKSLCREFLQSSVSGPQLTWTMLSCIVRHGVSI